MDTTRVFELPDLGEGLPDAEIVEWHVAPGDHVVAGQPLVSVETAKAVVEVPSPWPGTISRLCAAPGDIVPTGKPLVAFEGDGSTRQDRGSVVGEVEVGRTVLHEDAGAVTQGATGTRVAPAVRALARRLEVDLAAVTPTGPDGLITGTDVRRVARVLEEAGPLEPLRGPRRAMARAMAQAHTEVAAVTVCDDADVHAWAPGTDVTVRLVRAIIAACRAEPSLNAWYDAAAAGRRVLSAIHLGIAVDTDEGLFVPVLRDAGARDVKDLRAGLERMKADVRARSIPPEEMRGYTFTLSNFGAIAGRYADPVVQPPTVAILGAGRIREAVVAAGGQPAVHRLLPLSLSFDHRAVTGGEATRFLAAAITDLERA